MTIYLSVSSSSPSFLLPVNVAAVPERSPREMSEEKRPFERLPTDVVPVNYKVELRPDLAKFTFQGKLDITAKVRILEPGARCTALRGCKLYKSST